MTWLWLYDLVYLLTVQSVPSGYQLLDTKATSLAATIYMNININITILHNVHRKSLKQLTQSCTLAIRGIINVLSWKKDEVIWYVICTLMCGSVWVWISEVMASNSISLVETSFNITVLLPFPLNLTVAVVTERDWLPWCHPDASSEYHVYSNVPVEFEAFLPVSANLTFEWKVVENSTGHVDGEVTVAGVPCSHGQSCTSSIQVGC